MISFRNGMPFIITSTNDSSLFDREWIMTSLKAAAKAALYEEWWPAEDIAASIDLYLKEECEDTSITVVELETIISGLLKKIGYHTIAAHFFLPDPPATFSLMDLAEKAGFNYELLFFDLLKKHLQEIAESNTERVKIYDLNPCLYYLTHRVRVGRAKKLREEIVSYIDHYSSHRRLTSHRRKYQSLAVELV